VTPSFTRIVVTALVAAVFLGVTPSAFAALETGDAGSLPASAQNLGAEPVTQILGTFSGGGDVDVYRMCLSDGTSFSASTVGGTQRDTQLFLFNSQGRGVYSNDDADIGIHTSRLPAQHRFSPATPGVYYLAISSFNNDPQSEDGEIFPDMFTGSVYPDFVVDAAGVGGHAPVIDWAGLQRGAAGSYRINLTGTTGCDVTPPTVSLVSPVNGAHVKQGAEVPVTFSCADTGGSGLASCVGSVASGTLLDTTQLGPVSVTVTARDNADNETVITNTVTVEDQTKPTITLTAPAAGTYELGQRVLADYSCADEPGGSGLESCDGSVATGAAVDTASLGQKTFTVNASDHAGNTESKSVSYTVVDTRAPSIVVTTPAPGAVYAVGEQVTANYSCSDDGSGIATCDGSVANGASLDTGSAGEKTFTVNAIDKAGNPASKSVTYTVGDRTAPSIAFTSPTQGAEYTLGQKVLAGYSCADEPNGSGVAECEGTVPVGARLNTSSVGAKTFTVKAADKSGNAGSQTVSYSVVYDFEGFLWPLVNQPRVNRWKAGLPVPVRFSLGSYRGAAPVAAGYPKVAPVSCTGGAQAAGTEQARGSWKKRSVHASKRGGWTYMFLWKTEKNWAGGCRQLVLKLDDGTFHRVDVQFVGRGHHRDWDRDRDDDDR
jgi:Bacterial pre-peptidase C-terminal domain